MRIAIISDLHANLPALEDTLAGIDSQRPDAIYCLGDLVNQNVWNNEVVEIIRKRKIPTVRGNHDNGIAQRKAFFRFSYTFPEARKWGIQAIAFTQQSITAENRAFLGNLPFALRIEVPHAGPRPFTILMVHGSPEDLHDTLFRFMPKDQYVRYLNIAGTDMLLCGQAHVPYHYIFPGKDDNSGSHRHVLCPGSVGQPHDGNWRPSYLLLTLDSTKNLHADPVAIHADFYRVSYDLEKAVKAIKHSPLSTWYGSRLITG